MHPFMIFGAGALTGLALSSIFRSSPVEQQVEERVSKAQSQFPGFLEAAVASAKAAQQEEMGYSAAEAGQLAKGVLGKVPGMTEAVAMYYAMLDPDTPKLAKATIAASLLYLVSPWDVIPDSVPGLGQLDDAGVVFAAFADVYRHVKPEHKERAQAWLISHGVEPKPVFEIGRAVELFYPQEAGKPEGLPISEYSFGYAQDDEYGASGGVRSMQRLQRDRGDLYGYSPDDTYGLELEDVPLFMSS